MTLEEQVENRYKAHFARMASRYPDWTHKGSRVALLLGVDTLKLYEFWAKEASK